MNKQELMAQMSRQMKESFRNAEQEAMAEVNQTHHRLWKEIEQANFAWDKEHQEEWEAIRKTYDIKRAILEEQIKVIREQQDKAFQEYQDAQAEMWHRRGQDLKPIYESQNAEREINQAKQKAIEVELLAKYEAKLNARKSA